MPRQARIDIPGQLYHVMARGIERRRIFLDEDDYADFRDRISLWLDKLGGRCLAWCLMPNHFHLLVLRGEHPLSAIMHHAMTGYAINFNLRHHRAGHLFQNRYKAIICDLEEYLLELAPYIHLNPLRARLVKDLDDLKNYKWCGHAAVITGAIDGILDRNELLLHFGGTENAAVEKYNLALAERAAAGQRDLSGGGLARSLGGKTSALKALTNGKKVLSDQRVLGESRFVETVLKAAGEAMKKERKSSAEVLAEVERMTGVSRGDIFSRTQERKPAHARAVYCYLCKKEAGASGSELMQALGRSSGGVSRLTAKGRTLVEDLQLVR